MSPPRMSRMVPERIPPEQLLEKLERKVEDDPEFSTQDVEILRKIIEAYRGLAVLGKATKFVVALLAGVSVVAVGLSHLTGGLRKWLLP